MNEPGRLTGRLQSIGPYTLIDRIGAGGMGVVYRALDRRSGTVVAFKLLHEHIASNPQAVERFRREAHVASLLRSAYVVRTLEFGQEDGRYYLVTEFVDGRTLTELLADGLPDPLAAMNIISEAGLALDEAESRDITHRDIKPDNIMVAEDGAVRLADFGIASLPYLDGLTRDGSYIGTVAYSAPEQHRGDADIRSDIYSLGVVLYQLLAGRRPFEAATPLELMRMHESAPVPLEPLERVAPELRGIVAKCLAKDPAGRYQHASELIAALNAARPAVAAYRPIEPAEPVAPAPATDPDATAAVPLAGAVVGVTGTVAVMDSPPEPPAPAPASAGNAATPSGRIAGRRLLVGAAAVVALVGGISAAMALRGGGGENPAGGPPLTDTTATATATVEDPPATGTRSPGTTRTPGVSPTTDRGIAPAITPGTATPTPSPTTAPPTATNTPTATPTATPTTAPQPSFSGPVFAPTLSESGLPPAGASPSGGTITGCPVTTIYAYVTHRNVPIGTQLSGSWSFQGQFQGTNPAVTTDATDGATHYEFGNPNGVPPGTFSFVLTSGGATVASGSVTIVC